MQRRRGARRKMVWLPVRFVPVGLGAGTLTEFTLATAGDLQTITLGRGTVGPMYGKINISFSEAVVQDTFSSGAWGIRLKESDAPAGAVGAFSPVADGDSSDWMTWRAYTIQKRSGAGTGNSGEPVGFVDEAFIIRNPRKIDTDEELVMLYESAPASTAGTVVCFWIRVCILLP